MSKEFIAQVRRATLIEYPRALKHIEERLLEHLPDGEIDHRDQAALDDLEFMIRRVI